MKHKFLKFISVFLLLMSSLTMAHAITVTGGKVYYNNAMSDWSDTYKYMAVLQSNYFTTTSLSTISNTKLLYCSAPNHSGWQNETGICFFQSTDTWGDQGKPYSTITTYSTGYTNSITYDLNNSNNYYLFNPSAVSGKSVTASGSWNGTRNNLFKLSNTIKVVVKKAGATSYAAPTSSSEMPASEVKVVAYYLNGDQSATSNTVTLSGTTYSKTYYACPGGKHTLTQTANTGYTFDGFYIGDTKITSTSAYYQTSNSKITIEARYTENTYSITAAANPSAGGTVTPTTATAMGQITGGSITATENTGYHFVNWEVGTATGTFEDDSETSTTFYPTAVGTVEANFTPNTYAITLNGNGGSDGSATATYNSSSLTGYSACSWAGHSLQGYFTSESDGIKVIDASGNLVTGVSGYTDASGKWIKDDDCTLYAQWVEDITHYQVTFEENITAKDGAGNTINSGDEVVSGTSVTFSTAPATGYEVDKWSVNSSEVQTGGNSYTTTISAATAVSVTTKKINYAISYTAQSTGWTYGGSNPTKANYGDQVSFVVNQTAGYTVSVTSSDAALDKSAAPTYKFTMPAKAVAISVSASENKSTLTASVNSIGHIAGYSVSGANAIGVTTTATLTASAAGTGYTFEGWTLTNCTRTSGAEKSTTITVKGTGNGKVASAVANYAEDLNTGWRINLGYDGMAQWFTNDFVKKSGESTASVGYLELELQENYKYKFKVVKKSPETWYGNNGTMTHDNCTNWTFYEKNYEQVMGDAHIQCTAAGKYIFKVDYSGTDPVVSVTYPAAQTYTVTMAVDGPGTTTPATSVELNAFTGTEITATPTEHSGYHFKNWTGTDGITFADANVATTTAKATGTGTITAHFEKDTYIYFNNTIAQKWKDSPLYIYLYKEDGYWDEKTGTGAQTGGNYMNRYEMTKLPNTEIWSWHYDQLHNFQGENKITYVAFSDKDMNGYKDFYNGEATYKSYNDCMNMFVPDASQTPKQINNTDYYNDGFWRKYNSTSSKMYLHIWDVTAGEELDGAGYELTTKTAGNDAFNATVKLGNSHQYNIYIGSCDGKNYSRETTINSDNCSGIQLYKYDKIDDKSKLAYLNTGAGGNYVFTLTYDKDKMTLSVEYPVTANDYRVKTGTQTRYSNIIRSTEASGTISMFLNAGDNTLTYEEATNVDVDPIQWGNTKSINVNVAKAGVYTMTLTKGTTPTITDVIPYTGKYYVRTDCAQGGWNEYKTNDNNLMRYTERQPDYEDNPATGFNYYYCRWNENAEGNVRFVIANEINPCISDTLKADVILDDTEFLKGKANIRFSWNSNTNALNRAYISGSYDDEAYLQVRSDGSKLFKKQDGSEPITAAKLDDNNDWTYIIDVYANGGAQAAVSAKYNDKYQFFVGAGNAETGAVTGTIQVIKVASKAHMQLVYDFKTDRIVTGWIPGDVITADITLQSDAILTRVHQGKLSPIKFSDDGISVLEVQTMYGVLQLDKDIMTDGHTQDPDKIYERNIYWISFPFDVRVGDIFGVDGYGEKWVMQRYNGAKRAEIGWFAETATFWEYMDQNDIMEANVGYTLTLDPDYFDNASDAMWANSKTSVSFYFPSVTHNIDVVSNGQAKSSIPAHECKIDRTFGDGKNHMTTDANWNVIGIPTFQDLDNPDFAVPSVYKWDPATNTYSIQELKNFTLEASHAYFVQWGREDLVTWPNASIIKPRTAPYAYADAKNYMVELFFSYGDKEDHTYINLKDEAKQDFVLNEDMMKVTNSGQPNIYSYAGAYDVAYNATAFENQTVNLGVIARKNGSYTFAMPKDFSGKAVLVDLESGEATDLNLSDYTVELNKGTYNNRFQLLLEVEAKAPTNMNPTKGEWSEDGKTKKLFINDNIYLINGGRIYNVLGARP